MKTQFKILLVVLVSLIFIKCKGISDLQEKTGFFQAKQMDQYKVTYDQTYEQKWTPVINNNRETFLEFIEVFYNFVVDSKIVPQTFLDNIYSLMEQYEKSHPDMIEEVKAISKVSGVELKKLLIINFTYEIYAHQDACTSIVIRKKDGQIIQGRNLDFTFQEYYSKLSIQFDYYDKNDKLIYSTSQFVGYVLIVQGIRYGQYSVSLNERDVGTKQENYEAFLKGSFSNEYLIRHVVATEDTYQGAVEALQKNPVIAACYYILAGTGPNEGLIIEKNRSTHSQTYSLNDETWFLVATNVDQDELDDDGRRVVATKRIRKIGQDQMDETKLFNDILTVYTNFNSLTISTTLMNPVNNYFNQTVWI